MIADEDDDGNGDNERMRSSMDGNYSLPSKRSGAKVIEIRHELKQQY